MDMVIESSASAFAVPGDAARKDRSSEVANFIDDHSSIDHGRLHDAFGPALIHLRIALPYRDKC